MAPPAPAATGPRELRRLAKEQSKLLLRGLKGDLVASPSPCNSAERPNGILGVFMLPTST